MIDKIKRVLDNLIEKNNLKKCLLTNDELEKFQDSILSYLYLMHFAKAESLNFIGYKGNAFNNRYSKTVCVEGTDAYADVLNKNTQLADAFKTSDVYTAREERVYDVYLDTVDIYFKKKGYIEKYFEVVKKPVLYSMEKQYYKVFWELSEREFEGLKGYNSGGNIYKILYRSHFNRNGFLSEDYIKVGDKYILREYHESGVYDLIKEFQKEQSTHYLLDFETKKDVMFKNRNNSALLKEIRHAFAHSNVHSYTMLKCPSIRGRVFIFDDKALIMPQIMADYLSFYTSLDFNEYEQEYELFYCPNDMTLATDEKLRDYLANCYIVKISFKDVVSGLVVNALAGQAFRDFYKKQCGNKDLQSVIVEKLNSHFKDFKISCNPIKSDGFIYKYFCNKIKNEKYSQLFEIGVSIKYLTYCLGFDWLNVDDSSARKVDICRTSYYLMGLFEYIKLNDSSHLKTIGKIAKDLLALSLSQFFIYTNLIENSFVDNRENHEFLELISNIDFTDFSLCDKVNWVCSSRSCKSTDDKITILRAIRNSIPHDSFYVKLNQSGNMFDSELEFRLLNSELKVQINMKNFLKFISNSGFVNYNIVEKKCFEAQSFEDLKQQVLDFAKSTHQQ